MKKLNMYMTYLRLISFFLIMSLFACKPDASNYRVDRIIPESTSMTFYKNYSEDIKNAKAFSENFINSYLKTIDKTVPKELRKEFFLCKGDFISISSIHSSVAESCIYIRPGDHNELRFERFDYPTQAAIFGGLTKAFPSKKRVIFPGNFHTLYNNAKAIIGVTIPSFIVNLRFQSSFPKMLIFNKKSVCVLSGVVFELVDNAKTGIRTEIDGIGIFTGEKNFSWALDVANKFGEHLAELEIKALVSFSDFFQMALAHDKLKPVARKIRQELSRSEKDFSYDYPLWQFKMDVKNLEEKAESLGIDTTYIAELLKSIKVFDGTLLWYYSNPSEFMVQWSLLNAALFLLIVIFWIIRFKDESLLAILRGGFLKKWNVPAVIIGCNSYVLHKAIAEGITAKFWLLPGFLIVISVVFSLLSEQS